MRTIDDPFPAIVQVKPRTTAELQAANPRVLGHSFENETPYAEQWHLGVERRVLGAMARRADLRGQRRQAHRVLLQPERGAARDRLAGIAPADPAAQSPEQHAAVRSAEPLDLSQRPAQGDAALHNGLQFLGSYTYGKSLDYGGSAASGGGAVGNPQTVTNLEAGHGPSGFDVRHRAVISGVWELPWGPDRRWLREGGVLGAMRRRLAAGRDRRR